MAAGARIVIAGLGNELLSDDGVGVHAARLLARRLAASDHPDWVVAEVGTAVVDAMHLLEHAELVVAIDAMASGGPAGSMYRATIDDVEDADRPGENRLGLHQLGLLGALRMLALELGAADGRWRPPTVEIVGVEPETLAAGLELSEAVGRVLERVVDEVWRVAERWSAGG